MKTTKRQPKRTGGKNSPAEIRTSTRVMLEAYVKSVLAETPLEDIIVYDKGEDLPLKGVGYQGSISGQQFTNDAKVLWEKTDPNFVVIVTKNVYTARKTLRPGPTVQDNVPFRTTGVVEEMLEERNINPQKVHVLVVATNALSRDNISPGWNFVHDILGHFIESQFSSIFDEPESLKVLHKMKRHDVPQMTIRDLVDNGLYQGVNPAQRYAISDPGAEESHFNIGRNDDRGSDILGAIATKNFSTERAVKKIVENMTNFIDDNVTIDQVKSIALQYVQKIVTDVEEFVHTRCAPGYTTLVVMW